MKSKEILTKGNPFKTLLLFSLPMILSVTLQQVYNICDSMIAGRFISDNALSAVSASYPITVIYLAIATGFAVGANIITSRYIGEKNDTSVKESMFTALITIAVAGIIISIAGYFLADLLLKMIHVDDVYFNEASVYLKFYSAGILFLFVYNTVTYLFQALGNSRTPLYLLIFSTVLNLILDIIFVKNGMGIMGISLATLIAQALASVLAFFILMLVIRKNYKLKTKYYSVGILKKILPIAVPSIIQGSIISIGGVLIQSLINTFSPAVTAGYGAAYKICYVIVNIYTIMSNAISTFTSTNAGAKEYKRIRYGFYSGLAICGVLTVITSITFVLIPDVLLSIFENANTDPEVTKTGRTFIYCVAPFFVFLCFKIPCDGVLKGSKDMRSFMIGTFADLFIRVGMSYLLGNLLPESYRILGIFLSWPIGWLVGMALSLTFYRLGRWKRLIGYDDNATA